MATKYDERFAVHPDDFRAYDTELIRSEFLIEDVFIQDTINLVYSHYDRYIVGGAMPVDKDLTLDIIEPLKADYFLERREMGVINVGGKGRITVDGKKFDMDYKEALYIARGSKDVIFSSLDKNKPAQFYINSAPAHKEYETKKITLADAEIVELGSLETANARKINKMIVNSVVQTCQLQMGMTELQTGSIWNTMPPHTHTRRMEAYFYFELPEDQVVCHFMGQPDETRHMWLKNKQAILSPPWSIHAGAGTSNYIFIWGMAGENLDYTDMDVSQPGDLR
jgi:4-deoxy-L-threo-5-hexosulose-uronate ketol-isomerase